MPIVLKPGPSLPSFTFTPPSSPRSDDDGAITPPRPPADFIPERDMNMFGSRPLDREEPGKALVRCRRCGKGVMEWAAGEHQSELSILDLLGEGRRWDDRVIDPW
jgi:SAGA-associated factor 73